MTHEPDGPVTPPAHDGPAAPDDGSSELPPHEEPTTTGTLFIMIFFLMALAGMWGIMYFTLLNR
jgi:hypothetical protein